MAEDLRSQRIKMDPQVRHAVDNVETKRRMKVDRTIFKATGKDPDTHRARFFEFRVKQRGWLSSSDDGGDRYPEHAVKPKASE